MKTPHEDREVPSRDGQQRAAVRPEAPGQTDSAPVRAKPRLDRRSVQRLAAGGAGNKAVAKLVAQRSKGSGAKAPADKSASSASTSPTTSSSSAVSSSGTSSASSAETAELDTTAPELDHGPVLEPVLQPVVQPVVQLDVQRYAPVVKPPPEQAPGFKKTQSEVAAKKRHIGTHHPAGSESKSAQDAAVAPPDDKEAQGKAAQSEKMDAAKPGGFDKAAFVKAVNDAIAKQAPKNLDEADKFSDSGKAEKVKSEVDGQVGQGKDKSAKDIETTTKAAPDTSKAKDKPVTPMQPDQAPANPGSPDPAGAVPDKQPAEVTDFSEDKKATDQEMADAEVTEDQLKKGNEPQFDDAVAAKKEGEKHSEKAPDQARTAEDKQRDTAKQGAAAAGAQAMEKLTDTRLKAGKEVDGGKGDTKSKDEQKRAEVTAKLQKVFDTTKKDVESTLSGLDKLVDDKFTAGEKDARDAFTADHEKRMKAYKKKRYSGFTGGLKWAKDKLLGMPAEANDIFTESRKLYVAKMQGVISSVADVIGVELGKAKDRIAQGRQELKAEVDKLPADLKKFGDEAAKDFAGKFDDLDSQVDEKSQQLVTDLAQKYTEALNKVDEEIKKLQEENKGLWDKVKDAVVGVIKTILELKDMLLGVLAKAASAVMKIIKDPIGFLKNLVSAVGDGLKQFMQNIGDHLKKGLVSWLLGVSASAGIEIPAKFDLKGIIQLIASLLGLTWENLKSRIMRKGVPDEAMTAVEASVPIASALAKEGPAGAVEQIAEDVGDLKATLLEKISSFLIPTVLIAGITWVVSLFNPASAFIKAVKAIIDIVTFIVTQGAQIIEFVNTVLDAVIAIADGGGGGVPALVENALAKSIPVLIGVLAALLGVGGLANKVKNAVQSLAKPVNRAIDKVIDKIAAAGKKLWAKLKKKFGKDKDGKDKDKEKDGKDKKDDKNKKGDGKDDKKADGKPDDRTDVEAPKRLVSGGMFQVTEAGPEFNAELAQAQSGQVIHQTGGDPKQVTKSVLTEHSDARYDKPSRTLKLPKATVKKPSSLSDLGAQVAADTGVSKVEVHKRAGTVEFVGGINPETQVGGAPVPPTDEEAVRAAISKHKVIKFLEAMATNDPLEYEKDGVKHTVDMAAFERAWKDAPTRNWVKERFRGVLDGTHEWLPCEHILTIVQRQAASNLAHDGQKWIDLQNDMRSPTEQVVYSPDKIQPKKVTERQPDGSSRQYSVPQGHVGAVYYPTVENTSQQVVGRGRFHRALGNAFKSSTTPEGAAQAAYDVALEWVWDGTTPFTPDIHPLCKDKNHAPVTAAGQQAHLAKIKSMFEKHI